MKLSGRQIDSFLDDPGSAVAAVLIYGPDQGLVRERADRVMRAVAGSTDDPFRTASVTEQDVADDSERLAAERSAMAFGGGRRAVRADGGDRLAPAVERALAAEGDGLVIIVAGDLTPRAKLCKICETAPNAAAMEQVIRDPLSAAGLTIGREAQAHLAANLGNDRLISRRELEKLVLYMQGAGPEVTLADAQACVGDNAGRGTEAVTQALAGGDVPGLLSAYASARDLGETTVGMLRAGRRRGPRHTPRAGRRQSAPARVLQGKAIVYQCIEVMDAGPSGNRPGRLDRGRAGLQKRPGARRGHLRAGLHPLGPPRGLEPIHGRRLAGIVLSRRLGLSG